MQRKETLFDSFAFFTSYVAILDSVTLVQFQQKFLLLAYSFNPKTRQTKRCTRARPLNPFQLFLRGFSKKGNILMVFLQIIKSFAQLLVMFLQSTKPIFYTNIKLQAAHYLYFQEQVKKKRLFCNKNLILFLLSQKFKMNFFVMYKRQRFLKRLKFIPNSKIHVPVLRSVPNKRDQFLKFSQLFYNVSLRTQKYRLKDRVLFLILDSVLNATNSLISKVYAINYKIILRLLKSQK